MQASNNTYQNRKPLQTPDTVRGVAYKLKKYFFGIPPKFSKQPKNYINNVANLFGDVAKPFFHVEKLFIHIAKSLYHVEKLFIHVAKSPFHVEKLFIHVAKSPCHVANLFGNAVNLFFHKSIFYKPKY